jgi:5'-nucleotidase
MQNRRTFIKQVAVGSLGISTLSSFDTFAAKETLTKLTILHTNDMHSRIDPFPINHRKYPGLGGMSKIATLVNKVKAEEKNVLVLDAGDVFQGTPYFNLYGGELELKLMSQIGYDACTMGNHDFDNGLDGFNKVLPNANFPFLCANYNFSNTILDGKTTPYTIIEKDGLKIGIIGIGIQLKGLVDKRQYKETVYLDPIEQANRYATQLKQVEKCNLVVCLSHLGYEYSDNKLSDKQLAKNSKNIDLIIGGHTHTFLEKAETFFNKQGKKVLVNQAGWAALSLGRVDFYFDKKNSQKIDSEVNRFSTKNYATI